MDNYKKNIDTLKKHHPLIADWIESSKSVDWIEKIMSGKVPNILIKSQQKSQAIYDPKNPKKDAKLIGKNITRHRNNISVIIGLGCGYILKEILKNLKDEHHKIIVVEPITDFYKESFEHANYTKAIKDKQLFFATNENDFLLIASMLENSMLVEDWLLHIDEYTRLREEYFDLKDYVINLIMQLKCNTDTVSAAGKTIADNDMLTLPYVIKHRGVSELKDLYKDKSALIISTGPSLAKNIHLLIDQKVQDKFIIIAVGQALRLLLAYDITPDFICSVDYGKVNYGHYKNLMNTQIPLVALNRSYAPLIKNWSGPKFISITPNPGFKGTAIELLQDKGGLEQGGSVAHMAFGLATWLGCNVITLLGQDLAYGDGKSHISLVDEGGKMQITDQGEIKWEVVDPNSGIKGIHSMGGLAFVKGYFGKDVETNIGLKSFITAFEMLFAQYSYLNIINATEGGANIKGAKNKSFKKVIEDYAITDIDKSVIKPLLSEIEDADDRTFKAIDTLENDVISLEKIISFSKEALHAGKQLLKQKLTQKEKLKWIKEGFIATKNAHKLAIKNPLISLAIFKEQKSIYHRDLIVEAKVEHLISKQGKKDLKIRIKRNAIVLEAAKKSSIELIKSYQDTIKVLKAAVEDPDTLLPELELLPDMENAEESLKQGNWARPLTDAITIKRALENIDPWSDYNVDCEAELLDRTLKYMPKALLMRAKDIREAQENYKPEDNDNLIKYNQLVEDASAVGRNENDFKKALNLLKEANSLFPDKIEAKWGLASSLHMNKEHEKSLKIYKELCKLKDHPNILAFQFESALVYLESGDVLRAMPIFKKVLSETNIYNHFYKTLSAIYNEAGLYKEALIAIKVYLDYFPADYKGWNMKGVYLKKLGSNEGSLKAFEKAGKIKGYKR